MRFWISAAVAALLAIVVIGCSKDSVPSPEPPVSTEPAGDLYVLNQTDGTMYVYNAQTLQRTDSVNSVVTSPHHIEFSPLHDYLYIVGRTTPGQIAKFGLTDHVLAGSVTHPGTLFPTAIALGPTGQVGYVCDFNATGITHIHRLDLATMTFADSLLQTNGAQTHDIKITSDGTTLIACNWKSDNLVMVKLESSAIPDDVDSLFFPVLHPNIPGIPRATPVYGPYGVAIDHNDSLAYIACYNSDEVKVLDIKTRTVIDSIDVPISGGTPNQPYGPSLAVVTPNNAKLYVTTQLENTVVVINLLTRQIVKSIPTPARRPFGISVSDDGSRVYVACVGEEDLSATDRRGRIYVINTTTDAIKDSIIVGLNSYMVHYHDPSSHH